MEKLKLTIVCKTVGGKAVKLLEISEDVIKTVKNFIGDEYITCPSTSFTVTSKNGATIHSYTKETIEDGSTLTAYLYEQTGDKWKKILEYSHVYGCHMLGQAELDSRLFVDNLKVWIKRSFSQLYWQTYEEAQANLSGKKSHMPIRAEY